MLRKDLCNNFLRWKRSAFTPRNPQYYCFFYPKNSLEELFLSCKIHVFVIVSFLLSKKLMFLLIILKDLLNLHYKKKCEAELRNFFSLNFQWLQHDIGQFWWHQRSLETESGTSILQKPKQRRQYFNLNSYQSSSNIPYKE